MGLCFSTPSENHSTTTTRTPATVSKGTTATTDTVAERRQEAQNKAKAAQERRNKSLPAQGLDMSMRREFQAGTQNYDD